ncbi:hypothetical protein EDC16_102267 [Testudinibacter aquarius]|uniref:Uncharacterized protein n=1 Tax=Testudinibacter aquarius TaxID=1524974 RepID=A0A4R3YBQ0_9PAST|nr:hypothetical protein EDC16_102267 [Testudinibacter aquarius]
MIQLITRLYSELPPVSDHEPILADWVYLK